jgi:tripartite ATP-independent transporter DctP family solute receptor
MSSSKTGLNAPSRASFIAASAATFATVAFVRSPARAAQFTWKAGTNQTATHPLSVAMSDMAAAIKAETGGKLEIQVFPNNQLGGDTAMLTQLRANAMQLMTLDGGIMASVVPVAAIQSVGFAFKDSADAFAAFDGPLGAYVRSEIEAKDIHAFDKIWENGLRQITSSTHPIKNAADLSNFKIRTPAAKISLDLFKALGASPTPINFSEVYTALQTHVVDGQENPFTNIMTARFYEVQKYLSLSSHMWGGYWLISNGDAWKALPPDVQAIVTKHATAAALKQRAAVVADNAKLQTTLKEKGMALNEVDRAGMRAKLGDFYKTWKGELGDKAWGLLEAHVGKLG